MNMKRVFAALSVLSLLISFAACGQAPARPAAGESFAPAETESLPIPETSTSSEPEAAPEIASHPGAQPSVPPPDSAELSSAMTSPEAAASSPASQEAKKITFSEGTTMAKMFMLLEEQGIASRDAMFAAADSMDISAYPLAAGVQMYEGRCYRLEGYLFPDTYEFYVGEQPESILRKMLSNGKKRLSAYAEQAAALGMTMDDAIILASVIQKEAGRTDEMKTVSSVLHNRLDGGIRLQCDATISYVENVIVPFVADGRATYAATYNTYKCAGLPAGPICNPGAAALDAAVAPAATAYLFFAMDAQGGHYYSETYEEHEAVCREHGIGIYAG